MTALPGDEKTAMPRSASPKSPPTTRGTSHKKAARRKKPGGGTAAGGGINFQAAVTSIAGTHLLRGTPLGWLSISDVPAAVWAESEGPGDDLRLEILPGTSAEVQAKKGLNRGANLWEALDALLTAVRDGHLDYGILAVASDSSGTVRVDLAKDIQRIAQGRQDYLTDIGAELHQRLQRMEGDWQQACKKIAIRVVHAQHGDDVDINAAKEALRWVCADDTQVDAAWNALYRGAVALIEHRGRWTTIDLLRLLRKEGIAIRDADFPAAVATKLTEWVESTCNSFSLPAARKRLPLEAMLEMRLVGMEGGHTELGDAASALARYHNVTNSLEHGTRVYDAEWTGRFKQRAVVVAGPGLGKSTLVTLLANRYAADGFPVLSIKLKLIAASMERGSSFDQALLSHALDGSGISPEQFEKAKLRDIVILADGLDDCGSSHNLVAQALYTFSLGHPSARVIVTTRPIGYATAALSEWPHYRLLPPDKNQGPEHLAKLIEASKDHEINYNALKVAKHELGASGVAETISTSPQLLGMAATLISVRGELPASRPKLYERLVDLFETKGKSTHPCPVSSQVAALVLNVLGWLLMHDPLAPASKLAERCAELLAIPMGRSQLAMLEMIEPTMRYWEKLGIIEQLHHDGVAYWTFIHKTFTEFTAARYLLTLSAEDRKTEIERLLDLADWHEVIMFSGGLGLGDSVARLLIDRRETGRPDQMERALIFAADKDIEISHSLVRQLAELAFVAIGAEDEERFPIGLALTRLAKLYPAIIGPIVAAKLNDKPSSVLLVAWACAISANQEKYTVEELVDALDRLLPTVSSSLAPSLLGGMRLSSDKDRDLLQLIAIAAIGAQPDSDIKSFAETQLSRDAFQTVGFHSKVSALLHARGIAEIEFSWKRSLTSSAFALTSIPDEWRSASASTLLALAEASVGDKEIATSEPVRFLHFSALVALVGLNDVPAYDVHQWEKPYNKITVRTVIQALVRASAIDSQILSAEAGEIIRRARTDPQFGFLDLDFPNVDVPEPDWRKASMVVADYSELIAAMNHGSIWMAYLAGNMLAAFPATQEQSRTLLESAEGKSLWAATAALLEQQPLDVARALILDKLAQALPDGAEHLFEALQKKAIEHSPALSTAIERGMANSSSKIALAAANLAKGLAERGQYVKPQIIVDAYDDWLVRAPKNEGPIISPSPRAVLLQVMILLDSLDNERLFASLSDTNSDVRKVGENHVISVLTASEEFRDTVLLRIVARRLTPSITASILRHETPLSAKQVRTLEALLCERDAKWRRAGVELLRRCYLSSIEISEYAAKLSTDDHDEIRRAVKQRLAAAENEFR